MQLLNKILGHILSGVVRLYQITFGVVFGGQCRYHPSCSEYSRQSLQKHGAFKGLVRSAWRVVRCNPLSRGGYDPA